MMRDKYPSKLNFEKMSTNKIIRSICLMISLLLLHFHKGVCQVSLEKNEEIVFSFKTHNGKQVQVVKDIDDNYLFYRAIKNGKTEFQYPEKNNESWKKFTFTSYFRPNSNDMGMNLNFLEFHHEGYQYVVYDIYYEAERHDRIGVRVTEEKTQKTFDLRANNKTVKGDLRTLSNNELLPQKIGQLFE